MDSSGQIEGGVHFQRGKLGKLSWLLLLLFLQGTLGGQHFSSCLNMEYSRQKAGGGRRMKSKGRVGFNKGCFSARQLQHLYLSNGKSWDHVDPLALEGSRSHRIHSRSLQPWSPGVPAHLLGHGPFCSESLLPKPLLRALVPCSPFSLLCGTANLGSHWAPWQQVLMVPILVPRLCPGCL